MTVYTNTTPLTDTVNTEDAELWIWFQLLFGIGTRRSELLMSYFNSPKDIYNGVSQKNRVTKMLTDKEMNSSEAAYFNAKEIKRRTLKKGVDIITPDHPDYPELLKQIYAKPAVLYVKGDLSCLKDRLSIAMVGSRKHTSYGKKAADWIASGLAKGQAVVVSGLAHGIDTQCHISAVSAGGRSIGVLGCGIDIDYPKGNAAVKRLLCENGAVMTEYPLGTDPRPENFPTRNRIVSGMCHGVAVVEAGVSSGSLITAQHALEQGRDIFAVPGDIFSANTEGAHQLIKDGAKIITSAQEIFDEYDYLGLHKNISDFKAPVNDISVYESHETKIIEKTPDSSKENQENLYNKEKKQIVPDDISQEAKTVYGVINEDIVSVDYISDNTDISVSKILSALTELEIYGLIQSYPGRKFGIII